MQPVATTINVRTSTEVRELIDRAAMVQGKTRTDFMLEAATEAAHRVLLDPAFFRLDQAQWKASAGPEIAVGALNPVDLLAPLGAVVGFDNRQ